MVEVRDATLVDIPAIIEMGRALHAESPRHSYLVFSDQKVEALLRRMMSGTLVTPAAGGALVAEKDGKIIGVMGGFIGELWFSTDRIAFDYALYVMPEYRNGRAAWLLVKAFEAWAARQGAVDNILGTSSGIRAEKTVRFYEKLGYTRYAYAMIKRVKQ